MNHSDQDARFNAKKNVDPAEISKFETLAHEWWDKQGKFKPLHDINPLRLNYIDARATLAGKKVLDVGCGGGILSESMAIRGAYVTGIDMGDAPLTVAQLHSEEVGITIDYQKNTAEDMADQHPEAYDIVTCLEMLEHVPEPASIVNACARLVKPGGHLFFSTINKTLKAWFQAIAGAEYILNMLPRGTHDWKKFIPPHSLANMCQRSGLHIRHMTGMTYNPLTRQYKLKEHEPGVNYMLHATKNE